MLFNPDQWRGDWIHLLGCEAAATPCLDRLAIEGVSFRNAFCQNPVCTPSRCSFMTGWYPHVRGHRTMHFMLQPDEPFLLRDLKEAGYRLFWAEKKDLVPAQNPLDPCCSELSRPRIERPDTHQLLQQTDEPFRWHRAWQGCDVSHRPV